MEFTGQKAAKPVAAVPDRASTLCKRDALFKFDTINLCVCVVLICVWFGSTSESTSNDDTLNILHGGPVMSEVT